MAKFNLKLFSLILFILGVLVSTQASADKYGKEARWDSWGGWSGFYGGAHIGTEGVGLQGGYNWLDGSGIYGLEFDYSDDLSSVRGRVGQIFRNRLFYATAGFAFDNNNDDETGVVVGGGAEFEVRDLFNLSDRWWNLTTGVEGLYYDVNDSDFVFRARFNYRFGG